MCFREASILRFMNVFRHGWSPSGTSPTMASIQPTEDRLMGIVVIGVVAVNELFCRTLRVLSSVVLRMESA